jgi:hypothetical protein
MHFCLPFQVIAIVLAWWRPCPYVARRRSLNQKPFGSGEWYNTKSELLLAWLATRTSACPNFRRYADRIAADLGRPLDCEADYETLRTSLSDLPSFTHKDGTFKQAKWFSINQRFANQRLVSFGWVLLRR